jgi:hypothetical protein
MSTDAERLLMAALDPTVLLVELQRTPVLSDEVAREVEERVREAVGKGTPPETHRPPPETPGQTPFSSSNSRSR